MKQASSGGVGVLGILLVIFIVLKVLKLIAWSWWLVLIPLWIELGILVLAVLIGIIVAIVTD